VRYSSEKFPTRARARARVYVRRGQSKTVVLLRSRARNIDAYRDLAGPSNENPSWTDTRRDINVYTRNGTDRTGGLESGEGGGAVERRRGEFG